MARRANLELWSVDECHFQQHGSRCRMWVPPEDKDPILLHAPTRKSVACFGQSAHWAVRAQDLQGVQCPNLPVFPHAVAALSTARPPHDPHPRQRSLSSCGDPGFLPSPTRCIHETAVSSTLQPAARADRAGLETNSTASNAQPLFPYTRRSTPSRQCLLQSLASTKCDLAKIMLHHTMMLHYLRRFV